MNDSKVLVLVNKKEDGYFPEQLDYCNLISLYKGNNIFNRVVRKIILKYDIVPLEKIIFSRLISFLEQAEYVILFDTGNAAYIARFIKKIRTDIKVIIWYWNPVSASIDVKSFEKIDVEIWSFDPEDCRKYGLKYNTQFFIEDNLKQLACSKDLIDVFYVGADKNRSILLKELRDIFEKKGILYKFNLVRYKTSSNNYGIEYQQPLPYREVLEYIKSSKAVIDLVADGQLGLTLRPLEALFLQKKLITNMESITQYDFYNPNNIFILGKDDETKLKEFIESDYDMKDYDLFIKKYSFRQWIQRFDKNE